MSSRTQSHVCSQHPPWRPHSTFLKRMADIADAEMAHNRTVRVWWVMCPRLPWLLSPRKCKSSTLTLCQVAADVQSVRTLMLPVSRFLFAHFFVVVFDTRTSEAFPGGDPKS